MPVYKIYKSTVPSMRYPFKDGRQAIFIDGKFMTDDQTLIAEMQNEIKEEGLGKSKNMFMYIDPAEKELDSDAPTPHQLLLKSMEEKALENIKRALQQNHGDVYDLLGIPRPTVANSNTIKPAEPGKTGNTSVTPTGPTVTTIAPTTVTAVPGAISPVKAVVSQPKVGAPVTVQAKTTQN